MRQFSAKRAAVQRQRRAVLQRSHGPERCQWPRGCASEAVDAHEALSRARGGDPTDPDWLLCRVHHDDVTTASGAFLAWCIEQGLVRVSPPIVTARVTQPATVPSVAATERVQVNLRIDAELLAAIDARAQRYKLSRNAWMELALRRVAEMPGQVTRGQDQRF